MPLRVLLVDDEALARARLRTLLAACTETPTEVVGEAETSMAALQLVEQPPGGLAVDLLLLDVRMPGRDGMQLASALRLQPRPPSVVFVTAHATHALRAFELDAVDYLTKPVQRARLQDALHRVVQRRAMPLPNLLVKPGDGGGAAPTVPAPLGTTVDPPVLVVAERGRVLRVPFAEVLYLKAEMKYVTLRTADRHFVLDDSLADLAQRLSELSAPGAFLRIHRNAVVALAAVRELSRTTEASAEPDADADAGGAAVGGAAGSGGWAVRVAPVDEWLPVSRRLVAAVRDALASGARGTSGAVGKG